MAKNITCIAISWNRDMLSITNVLGVSGRVVMSPPLKIKRW